MKLGTKIGVPEGILEGVEKIGRIEEIEEIVGVEEIEEIVGAEEAGGIVGVAGKRESPAGVVNEVVEGNGNESSLPPGNRFRAGPIRQLRTRRESPRARSARSANSCWAWWSA